MTSTLIRVPLLEGSQNHRTSHLQPPAMSGNFCSGCGKGTFRRMDIHQRSCKCALSTHCHLPEVDTDGFTTSGCPGHAMTDQHGSSLHGSSLDENAVSNNVRYSVCQSFFSNNNLMWQHVNRQHISRQFSPPVSVLKEHGRKLYASCGFSYSSHWQLCRRSLSPGHQRCGGQMTEPELSLVAGYAVYWKRLFGRYD